MNLIRNCFLHLIESLSNPITKSIKCNKSNKEHSKQIFTKKKQS